MQTRKEGFVRRAIVLMAIFVFTMIASAAFAQGEFPDPRMDVFVGYSYYNPGIDPPEVPMPLPALPIPVAPPLPFIMSSLADTADCAAAKACTVAFSGICCPFFKTA